jgi:hypothetical protein
LRQKYGKHEAKSVICPNRRKPFAGRYPGWLNTRYRAPIATKKAAGRFIARPPWLDF